MSTTVFASVLYTTTTLLAALSFCIGVLSVLVALSLSSNLAVTTPLFIPTPTCTEVDASVCSGDPTLCPFSAPTCYVQVDISTTAGPTALTIFAGVAGLLVGIAILVAGTRLVKGEFWSEEARHRYVHAFLATTLVYLCLCVAILVYVFVAENTQKGFDVTQYYGKSLKGPFTREKWVCGLKPYAGQAAGLEWTSGACTQAKVARWGLVPLTACAAILVACGVWLWRRERPAHGRVERLDEVIA